MKKITILMLMLIATTFSCMYILGDVMEIDHSKTNTVTTNTNNHVGVCSNTSIRSGFDAAASSATYNDTNTRFFSKSGSGVNTGLYASPLDTLENCIAKCITDSKTNCMCLDSGTYEGVVTSEIPANFKILAVNGQTPKLKWAGTYISATINTILKTYEYGDYVISMRSNNYIAVSHISDRTSWTARYAPGSVQVYDIATDGETYVYASTPNGLYKISGIESSPSWVLVHATNTVARFELFASGVLAIMQLSGSYSFLHSIDGGTTWVNNGLPTEFNTKNPRIVGQGNGARMFLSVDNNIYISDNYGQTVFPTNSKGDQYIISAIDQNDDIYISYLSNIYKSVDNGTIWDIIKTFDSTTETTRGTMMYSQGTVYLAVRGLSGGDDYIAFSGNGGNNWSKLSATNSPTNSYISGFAYNFMYSINEIISMNTINMLNNTLEINGFYLDGNNKQALGIISGTGSQTNLTLKYCDLDEYYYSAVQDVDHDTLTIQYCRINGGLYGVK